MLEPLGHWLATFLSREGHVHSTSPPTNQEVLKRTLRPADVLLVEGTSIISIAIKYLTQSTWSHAALYVGDAVQGTGEPRDDHMLVEADLMEGVRSVGLQRYAGYHCRVCRPVGLSQGDVERVVSYATGQVGHAYDTQNIVDLARYLLPTPPVPTSWRRKMIAFGSGDPTRAICSGLIAQSFETIGYPVLPDVTYFKSTRGDCLDCMEEVMRVRHHSLYVPRDFDVSPYFEIVKPSLVESFDYRALNWVGSHDLQLDIGPGPRHKNRPEPSHARRVP
jgi:Permuted papain-like amidase enzyme, YaeF/YiiX, C92 family